MARLFAYQNPLKQHFEILFFKAVPKNPGVYRMFNVRGELLYVGKSNNLRRRLYSYYRAKPKESPRKVLRLLKMVRKIEWEICESDTAAILLENSLLRTLKPPFNVVNTRPELYYYVGYERFGSQLRFRLTTRPEKFSERFFGAFRGRSRTREAFTALLRLIWASQGGKNGPRFEFPANLTRKRPPFEYHLMLSNTLSVAAQDLWFKRLDGFLLGKSDAFLEELVLELLENTDVPKFYRGWVQEDLDLLKEFYTLGPSRNRAMQQMDGKDPEEIIAQERLDDLITLFRAL